MKAVMGHTQKGATLIVVLVLLVIITILGVMAIRQSLTSLNIATNSQAQSLLMQNSDAYYFKIEGASATQKILNASKFGFIGFAAQPENIGKEIVFCYTRNTEQNFDTNTVGIISNSVSTTTDPVASGKKLSSTTLVAGKFCNPATESNFTSGRKAVMTQVHVKVQNTPSAPLENFVEGTDTELVNQPMRVRINTISLLPAMTSGTTTNVTDCMSKYPADPITDANGTTSTVADCLKFYNVPFNAQVAEYKQSNAPM